MKHIDSESVSGYGAAESSFPSAVLLSEKKNKGTYRIQERKKTQVIISVVVGFGNGVLEDLCQDYHQDKAQCSCGHQCLPGILLYLHIGQVPAQKEVCGVT